MSFRPIYEPRTRAREYSDLAINIYKGCNHGCYYCYARDRAQRYTPKDCICSFNSPKLREGIVEATKNQLSGGKYKGKKIMLCFMCDPYPAEIDTTPTREIIKVIKAAGANVSILTKGASRSERDFDLLDNNDSFGVTISCNSTLAKIHEPNADNPFVRLLVLDKAKEKGIKTWVSCEPVLEIEAIYKLIIEYGDSIDLFKIGKLNHRHSDINWGEFGRECERLCKGYGRNYYIKEDLRREMEK
jgi:DNA repair photolyase